MQVTKELIQRYHLGQCSLEEQAIVEQWLESDEVEWSFPEGADLQAMEDKGWRKISDRSLIPVRLAQPVRPAAPAEPMEPVQHTHHIQPDQLKQGSIKSGRNYRWIWQLAACTVLVLGTAWFYHLKYGKDGYSNSENTVQRYQKIQAVKGRKVTVSLPDGTLVQLNSESTLRFPEKFAASSRQVELTGEAFFKVVKDSSRPFSIRTENTAVTVLGTSFNLRAYAAEHQTSVVVADGRVRFSGKYGKEQLVLNANQQGIYNGSSIVLKEVLADKYMAWKSNRLVFDDERLEDIVKTLERWYNVNITIKNSGLANERYTGKFDEADLKTVLESLSFAIRFNYHQKDNTYVIYTPRS